MLPLFSTTGWRVSTLSNFTRGGILPGDYTRCARWKTEKMLRRRSSVLIFGAEGNEDGRRLR